MCSFLMVDVAIVEEGRLRDGRTGDDDGARAWWHSQSSYLAVGDGGSRLLLAEALNALSRHDCGGCRVGDLAE